MSPRLRSSAPLALIVAVLAVSVAACNGSSSSNGKVRKATTSTSTSVPLVVPALEVPAGVPLCRASELEFAALGDMEFDADEPRDMMPLGFFNRSGRPCGLAGYVTIYGQNADGAFRLVPTTSRLMAPVDADRWTGVFEPSLTAVIRIWGDPECLGDAAAAHYTALRVVLPGDAGAIDIPGVQFDTGRCPLLVTPVGGDSGDF